MSVPVTGTLEPYANGNFRVIDDTFIFLLGLGTDLVVGSDSAPDWPVASYQGQFHRWDCTCKTAPVGADLVLDVLFSTNSGSSFTSLWAGSPSNRPTIAASAKQGGGTAFTTSTYIQGTIFRIDVIQVGSSTAGQGLMVKLV